SPSPFVHDQSPPLSPPQLCTVPPSSNPCPTITGARYIPPPARPFTEDDRKWERHHITCKTSAHAVIEHPVGAIVEYPQTGQLATESVAHIFHVNPSSFSHVLHPKSSFQYSLGDGHGGRMIGQCLMLRDAEGNPVPCTNLKTSCKSESLLSILGWFSNIVCR
ncbi:hypothetical protein M405DRAFT_735014, partial [Rhizopogon salebrosus TDB-379]